MEYDRADPDIAAVVAASDRAVVALLAGDGQAFASLHAHDCIINSPANRVITGDQAARAFDAGLIDYEHFERRIEIVEKRAGLIVVMGEEIMVPQGRAADAGRTVRRRFTDVWNVSDETWKVVIRQATVTSVK